MTKAERKAAYEALMKFYPFSVGNLDSEEWKDIRGYGGDYQISNFGRVKSFHNGELKILKPYFNNGGYLYVVLSKAGKTKHRYIHRLVAETFLITVAGKSEVNHVDCCNLNNYVGNLEWCTSSENKFHALKFGRKENPQGTDCSWAKFTAEQVTQIRENTDALSTVELAKIFGVNESQISAIQLGKTYRNVGGKIRKKIDQRIPTDIRRKIRNEYIKGSKDFGSYALAKKYGCGHQTILNIVKEVD